MSRSVTSSCGRVIIASDKPDTGTPGRAALFPVAQRGAGAADARHDRARGNRKDRRGLGHRQPFDRQQMKRLALVAGQGEHGAAHAVEPRGMFARGRGEAGFQIGPCRVTRGRGPPSLRSRSMW